jgi:hypothetical protein
MRTSLAAPTFRADHWVSRWAPAMGRVVHTCKGCGGNFPLQLTHVPHSIECEENRVERDISQSDD